MTTIKAVIKIKQVLIEFGTVSTIDLRFHETLEPFLPNIPLKVAIIGSTP